MTHPHPLLLVPTPDLGPGPDGDDDGLAGLADARWIMLAIVLGCLCWAVAIGGMLWLYLS